MKAPKILSLNIPVFSGIRVAFHNQLDNVFLLAKSPNPLARNPLAKKFSFCINQEAPATRKDCDVMSPRMRGVNHQSSIINRQSSIHSPAPSRRL